MAYNLFVGGATNATKSSSDGHTTRQCQMAMFNNTYINCGQRSELKNQTGLKGGDIEIENNSRALAFNNLMVNCRYGLRVAGGVSGAKVYLADTAQGSTSDFIPKTAYGYNYYYADDSSMTNQFLPTNIAQAVVTTPQSTGIPNMAAFLGSNYTFGKIYDGSSLVSKNNPMFTNFPLPAAAGSWKLQASIDNYKFSLSSTSPALGAGTTTAFSVPSSAANGFALAPISNNFGVTQKYVTPGKDMGCYQADGSGNQH
jgi:hypothetical protein